MERIYAGEHFLCLCFSFQLFSRVSDSHTILFLVSQLFALNSTLKMHKSNKLAFEYKLSNEWTHDDWTKAAALTLLPGFGALYGAYAISKNKNHEVWWEVRFVSFYS
jgi:hypothetical protein